MFGDMVLGAEGACGGESDAARGLSDVLETDSRMALSNELVSQRATLVHVFLFFVVAMGRTHRKLGSSRRHTPMSAVPAWRDAMYREAKRGSLWRASDPTQIRLGTQRVGRPITHCEYPIQNICNEHKRSCMAVQSAGQFCMRLRSSAARTVGDW